MRVKVHISGEKSGKIVNGMMVVRIKNTDFIKWSREGNTLNSLTAAMEQKIRKAHIDNLVIGENIILPHVHAYKHCDFNKMLRLGLIGKTGKIVKKNKKDDLWDKLAKGQSWQSKSLPKAVLRKMALKEMFSQNQ